MYITQKKILFTTKIKKINLYFFKDLIILITILKANKTSFLNFHLTL